MPQQHDEQQQRKKKRMLEVVVEEVGKMINVVCQTTLIKEVHCLPHLVAVVALGESDDEPGSASVALHDAAHDAARARLWPAGDAVTPAAGTVVISTRVRQ